MNVRELLEASGFAKRTERVRKRVRLLRELVKLFLLEARENPKDAEYLFACAKDIYRRYRLAGGTRRGSVRDWLTWNE